MLLFWNLYKHFWKFAIFIENITGEIENGKEYVQILIKNLDNILNGLKLARLSFNTEKLSKSLAIL